MMLRGLAAAAVLSVGGFAPAAFAQPASAKPAAASANPEAEALVRRYLAAIHIERNLEAMVTAMTPLLEDQLSQQESNLTTEQKQMIIEIVQKLLREKMGPKMIERMTPIYASIFTQQELKALVEFYESPTGRAITDKIPLVAPKAAEVTRALMPEMMRDVVVETLARMCPSGKCEAAKPPRASAS